jgi:hypothetical protein
MQISFDSQNIVHICRNLFLIFIFVIELLHASFQIETLMLMNFHSLCIQLVKRNSLSVKKRNICCDDKSTFLPQE